MSVEIIVSSNFRKEAKSLIRKFPSLIDELEELQSLLLKNPKTGTPLGRNCYKIRIAIKSKGKGKSGGARIISLVLFSQKDVQNHTIVNLMTIYDKSNLENISQKELSQIIDLVKKEMDNNK